MDTYQVSRICPTQTRHRHIIITLNYVIVSNFQWCQRVRGDMNALNIHKDGSVINKSLVVWIRHLLKLDWEVVVHYSYCEANWCAKVLVNLRCSLNAVIHY